jgi:hypothetical protein
MIMRIVKAAAMLWVAKKVFGGKNDAKAQDVRR